VDKLTLTEIVIQSHKITEIYESAHGSHLLPYGASLFIVSYFTGQSITAV